MTSQQIIDSLQNVDYPDLSIFDNGFFGWNFGENASNFATFFRGILSNCPTYVSVFITLAFGFFTVGLLFRLFKQLL